MPRPTRPSLLTVLGICISAGCSSAPPPPPLPTLVNITITASPDMNPDASGQAQPLMLRVYRLASANTFERADYFQLMNNGKELLGADLVGEDDFTMTPGGEKTISYELPPPVRAIGIAASFQDIDNTKWRATLPVSANQTTSARITLHALEISLAGGGN